MSERTLLILSAAALVVCLGALVYGIFLSHPTDWTSVAIGAFGVLGAFLIGSAYLRGGGRRG